MDMNARIHLKNMAFYGYHGNLSEETRLGQRFFIDLTLTTDVTRAVQSDKLEDTVDYTRIYNICRDVMANKRCKLLESLANLIINRILESCHAVNKVEILIRKPAVPIPGILDHVAIEAEKSR